MQRACQVAGVAFFRGFQWLMGFRTYPELSNNPTPDVAIMIMTLSFRSSASKAIRV